jgi:hypothetical protein
MAASTSSEIQVEAIELQNRASSRIGSAIAESQDEEKDASLILELEHLLEMSEPPFHSLDGFGIYRVPRDIRELNEKAYTPKCISIGPFHFLANETLRGTEKLKQKYFKMFMKRAQVSVEELVGAVSDSAVNIRGCYAGTTKLDNHNYLKMIVLDASFIIVFFLISYKPAEWEYKSETTILNSTLRDDLLLLENQLPFFIIEKLYNLAFSYRRDYPSFKELAYDFFKHFNTQNMPPTPNFKIMHIVDLIRSFFLPNDLPHKYHDARVLHLYTASQLHEAGVKFKVSSSKCVFDLKFTNGVLEIPRLQVDYLTECLFRNIMALEQFYYQWESYVSDYIRILDFLIDTTKDVDLLVKNKILVNNLGDSNAVATMVNNLNKCIFLVNMNSNYCGLCKALNAFYEHPWHSWRVALRRDHFSNPWKTMATVGAIILLVLTLGQTICSIISVV